MKFLLPAFVASSLLAAVPASAVTIAFQDDFSSYGSSTVTNAPDALFNGVWTTTSGTVDYLAAGSAFDELCPSGQNCIDLDGSTGAGGVFQTVQAFGAGLYNVLFQISGNNRGGSDTVTISFGGVVQSISLAFNQVASQASFGSAFLGINVAGSTTLSFANAGGDNIGIILKNVTIENADLAPVPVPAAGGLLLAALGAVAALRRRKAAV